jgi:hypothetical protein
VFVSIQEAAEAGLIGFRTFQVCAKDLRALPGHPEPALSWHSGFRGGAHVRPKTTPVHHAARRRGVVAARGARAAASDAGDWIPQQLGACCVHAICPHSGKAFAKPATSRAKMS